MWLFQICYLDSFYKYIRRRTVKTVRNQAIEIILSGREDVGEQLDLLAAKNNLAIFVTDLDGQQLYNAEYIATSRLNTLPKREFESFYRAAEENGGSAEITFKGNQNLSFHREPLREELEDVPEEGMPQEPGDGPEANPKPDVEGQQPFMQNHGQEMAESVIYITLLESEGQEMVFLLNCTLTPVYATVHTLKIQLIFISILMLILSVVLALMISRQISKSMILLSGSAAELAHGNYDVVFEGRDYREIAELSDTLNYTAKELGKTENLRRELIANVSHDLKTPLTMIVAYAEAMRDLPGENTPENIQVVIDEAGRLTNLVNDMLDLSKLQSGVMEKDEAVYNLTDSICLVLKRYNKLVEQDGYQIEFRYERDAFVKADEYKIYQVIYNLINNAIHYTGEDKTVIVNQILSEGNVRIEVTDFGEGISKAALPYVWDRYYKIDKNHKRAVSGTGLGLSIVKNILELHQASYGVKSVEGRGSTFWFEIEEYVAK